MADEPRRDRAFRHELFPEGAPLVRLADAIVTDLLAYEEREGVRRRARKTDAQADMRHAVRAIVANLAHMVLILPHTACTGLILPVGHRREAQSDEAHKGFGKALPALLESLHALAALTLHKPEQYRSATTIQPTTAFRRRMLEEGVSLRDIGRRIDPMRLVRLSRREGDRRTYFAVPDTAEADHYRSQMRTINAGLATALIAYLGNDAVDVGDRLLVRRFNLPRGVDAPCLEYGGRLCGGFWQTMPKVRRQHIRIGDEPVAELDYGQMFPRLAYGVVGAAPEAEDLYGLPGLAEHRSGVKRGFNALLWGAKRWNAQIAATLPRCWTATALRQALVAHHPAIAELLRPCPLVGYRLMHRESAVLVAVLLACIAVGITALPIHDAVLVPVSAAETVSAIMEQSALAVAGVHIPVNLKA